MSEMKHKVCADFQPTPGAETYCLHCGFQHADIVNARRTPGPLVQSSKLVREGLRIINAEMSAYADVKASEDAEGRREARAVRAALAALSKAAPKGEESKNG